MLDRYTTPEMRHTWSLDRTRQLWLRVEFALMDTQVQHGVLSGGDCWSDVAARRALVEKVATPACRQRLALLEQEEGHEFRAFLHWLEEETRCKFWHFGLTSSDVQDTALSLVCREATTTILEAGQKNRDKLKALAERYMGLPTIGRTHGMHASPRSFGQLFGGAQMELERALHSLYKAAEEINVGKFSGTVGAYSSGAVSPDVEGTALRLLGISWRETAATQIICRDRYAALVVGLARVGTALERLATNLRLLHRTEVGEADEGTNVGSSAMAHKRNPASLENICSLSRMLRSFVAPAMESCVLWHERDLTHSAVERHVLPQAFSLCHFMLWRMNGLLLSLSVDEVRVQANLGSSAVWASERLLLWALRYLDIPTRAATHEWVRQCYEAWHLIQDSGMDVGSGMDFYGWLQNHTNVTAAIERNVAARSALGVVFDLGDALQYVMQPLWVPKTPGANTNIKAP